MWGYIVEVWLPIVAAAGAVWMVFRHIKAVVIIAAIVAVVVNFFWYLPGGMFGASTEATAPAATATDPTPAYIHSLPRPVPPDVQAVQAKPAPPCVAPPPRGRTTYFCDAEGHLRFKVSMPGGSDE